jgi:hypothetical protein
MLRVLALSTSVLILIPSGVAALPLGLEPGDQIDTMSLETQVGGVTWSVGPGRLSLEAAITEIHLGWG